MRIAAPLFALACVRLIAQPAISPVAFTESKQVIRAFSSSGEITLPAVRLQLDINYPRGKKERGDLVTVYDPQNGHYLWRYRALNSPSDTGSFLKAMVSGGEAFYAAPAALVDFHMPGAMYVKEHAEHADSLDAAERASIDEIQRGLPVSEGRGHDTNSKMLPVFGAIGSEFDCVPMHANCQSHLRSFVSISQQGDDWRLVLRNRFDQEVILDSKFNLVSTRRLTQPPK